MPSALLAGSRPRTLRESWTEQAWAIRLLRAFLGGTFVYAGIQKFADPEFFRSGSPQSIGAQLQSFARGSPIASVLHLLAHFPTLTGAGIALAEIAVGLGTLLGIAPLTSALAGLAINLALLLSATWHVHPYFLGSDSIYAVAWGAYAVNLGEHVRQERTALPHRPDLTGRARPGFGGAPASVRSSRSPHRVRVGSTPFPARRAHARPPTIGRREAIRGAFVGVGALILGSAGFLARRSAHADTLARIPSPTTKRPAATPPHTAAPTPDPSPSPPPVQGTPLVSLSDLAVGDALGFQDPTEGPAVLIRLGQDQVAAYSRTCTHAGCLVGFDPSSSILFCPCHGAEFDPSHGAVPIAGPAPTPLASINVVIDKSTDQVILPG
jgi:thiosulfate dehydrogenase [quinone] large subunit